MIGRNLKYLRKKNNLSQQSFSEVLSIPRTTLGDYEREKTEPNISTLLEIANYFDIKVDQLIGEDLSLEEYQIMSTGNFKILAISVNDLNEGNIELVDSKAEAGYLDSYQNPEFIKDLPRFQIPKLPKGTYRAFEIQGDSMLPLPSGSIVIASYVEKLEDIKDDQTYVIISQTNGLVYKRVRCDLKDKNLVLSSDNETYVSYTLDFSEVQEVWKYYAHIGFDDSKADVANRLESKIGDIHSKVIEIHNRYVGLEK